VNDTLPKDLPKAHLWQKPHQQNLTGSAGAYYPEGHILSGGKRAKATGDYEAWRP
jgi:NADH:ubiquinone oxidoreductase subunit